jgi:hypothetical protein
MILKFKSPYQYRHDRDDLTYSLCDIINRIYIDKDINAKPVTTLGEHSKMYIYIETLNNNAQFISQLGYDLGKLSEQLLQLA